MSIQEGKSEIPVSSGREDVVSQILKTITEKGWAFYYRGPSNAKISHEETIQRGPVDSLELGVLYLILPKVNDPTSEKAVKGFIEKHQVMPKIKVPLSGFRYFGRVMYQFGGDEIEDCLMPGQEIDFIGIELRDKEARLLSPQQTFMSYEVFQVAILSLRDISGLD